MRKLIVLALISAVRIASAGIVYNVNLTTAPLIGNLAGPFSLGFQFADGSGTGDGNNTVTLSNFNFGSGGPDAVPVSIGGVSGNLASGVVLTDTGPINFFAQQFTPGDSLAFDVSATTNADTPFSDQFIFYILDSTLTPIPTQAGEFFDGLLSIDLNATSPNVLTFSGDSTRLPAAGGTPIAIDAPAATSAPEPGFLIPLTPCVFLTFFAQKARNRRRLKDGPLEFTV